LTSGVPVASPSRAANRRAQPATGAYDIGQYLASEIVKAGPFELLCDSNPNTGIPTVTWRIREGEDPGYTLFDLADRLRGRGWQVPAYTLTGSVSDIAVQRILVRLAVSQDMASLLLDDFRDAVAHFGKPRSPCR
jgi:glutamate decarboxylase